MGISPDITIDIAIAGGGLAGSLIAWRLKQVRPDLNVIVLEQGEVLGGKHTWSFHHTDLTSDQLKWLKPLIVHQWDGQRVIFPAHKRTLTTPYYSITSDRLADIIGTDLRDNIFYSQKINSITAHHIKLDNGETITAKAVIDCLGDRENPYLTLGFQKFVGQEVKFINPHGLSEPIIMDASVPQLDGYRFLYVLPYDEDTALIEDTRYADGSTLDAETLRGDICDYAQARGWQIAQIIREEEGVLPIALGGDIEAYWPKSENIARAGMAAALFHPLTGYSLPNAVQLADKIVHHDDFTSSGLCNLTRSFALDQWQEGAFYRLLCRMLFRAAKPDQRYKVLQRFYKLPQPLIERFYAGASPIRDKARILAGKPPVPIGKALMCLKDNHVTKISTSESAL